MRFKFVVEPISDTLPVEPLPPEMQEDIEWIENMVNERLADMLESLETQAKGAGYD